MRSSRSSCRFMLRDGTVLAAGVMRSRATYGEGSSAADDLAIAYAAIDARDPSEDELRAVAIAASVFEDDANAAFERALERKSGRRTMKREVHRVVRTLLAAAVLLGSQLRPRRPGDGRGVRVLCIGPRIQRPSTIELDQSGRISELP